MWGMQNCRTLILCLAIRCSCNASGKNREAVCAQVAVITVEESISVFCREGEAESVPLLKSAGRISAVFPGRFKWTSHTKLRKLLGRCAPSLLYSKISPYKLDFSFVFPENFLNFCWCKHIWIWGYASVEDALLSWERLPFYGFAQEGNAGIWQYWARKKIVFDQKLWFALHLFQS